MKSENATYLVETDKGCVWCYYKRPTKLSLEEQDKVSRARQFGDLNLRISRWGLRDLIDCFLERKWNGPLLRYGLIFEGHFRRALVSLFIRREDAVVSSNGSLQPA